MSYIFILHTTHYTVIFFRLKRWMNESESRVGLYFCFSFYWKISANNKRVGLIDPKYLIFYNQEYFIINAIIIIFNALCFTKFMMNMNEHKKNQKVADKTTIDQMNWMNLIERMKWWIHVFQLIYNQLWASI